MKDPNLIAHEAFTNFIRSHPELNVAGMTEGFTKLFMDEKRIYARLAVDFTVQYVIEQIQIDYGGKDNKAGKKKNDKTDSSNT